MNSCEQNVFVSQPLIWSEYVNDIVYVYGSKTCNFVIRKVLSKSSIHDRLWIVALIQLILMWIFAFTPYDTSSKTFTSTWPFEESFNNVKVYEGLVLRFSAMAGKLFGVCAPLDNFCPGTRNPSTETMKPWPKTLANLNNRWIFSRHHRTFSRHPWVSRHMFCPTLV